MLARRRPNEGVPVLLAEIEDEGDACERAGTADPTDDVETSMRDRRACRSTRRGHRREAAPAAIGENERRPVRLPVTAVPTHHVETATVGGRHRMIHGEEILLGAARVSLAGGREEIGLGRGH